jgi:hypothetical protein
MFRQFAKTPSADMLTKLLANDKCKELLSRLSQFREGVRKGELGNTPQFWLLYMDRVWYMLNLLRATKANILSSCGESSENDPTLLLI